MLTNISILLINPWIYDFAAYNLWSAPLGLYYVASILRNAGIDVTMIDCMVSRYLENPRKKPDGRSKYLRRRITKPSVLSFVPRYYAVYGISEEEFIERLSENSKPDMIFITSIMTYWYPGVFRVIDLIRQLWGNTIPIVLGGIYAKLCTHHARTQSKANIVYTGDRITDLFPLIEDFTGKRITHPFNIDRFSSYPFPLHRMNMERNFITVLTQRGCTYRCSYCASPILSPVFESRTADSVYEEILRFSNELKTQNIAFYDDAFLVGADNHIIPLFRKIVNEDLSLSFYLPNGVHARHLDNYISKLFFNGGVKKIWLGLETSDVELQHRIGAKTTNEEYRRAVAMLLEAGFEKKDIGTYVLAGIPDQSPASVESALRFVSKAGASPYLSLYSPIPKTTLFNEARRATLLDIEKEPLFQNNSVYILSQKQFSGGVLQQLKEYARELRGH